MTDEVRIFSEVYVKCDVPSDTIARDPAYLRKFKLMLPKPYCNWAGKMISAKLIALRKSGNLPTIRGGHGPSKGSGGGHGKKKKSGGGHGKKIKTRIHVNKHVIASNTKHDKCEPPLTVKTYKSNDYCHRVAILDKDGNEVGWVVHSPDKPLSCGARVWVELKYGVEILE